eukprot:7629351-Alexandrium_andersonii.AAC.1
MCIRDRSTRASAHDAESSRTEASAPTSSRARFTRSAGTRPSARPGQSSSASAAILVSPRACSPPRAGTSSL